MKPERWQQVKQLFDAALDRAPDERARLLAEACADDETLRREVEMLLASHEHAASFMETPAIGQVAQVIITDAAPTLTAGASVGHYRIVKPLGAGGMGEVYLAEDVRLGRQVALKVLPAMILADGDARRRFAQEARAASTLNHPHIVTIYDVELADTQAGRSFIAMELVAGESLADKLKGAPLPATEIINITAQMADALDAAHTAGIVHRDIKPANIMLNERGQVKMLDFGLAKMSAPPSLASEAATQLQTAAGAILGTVSYMSPEQALGQQTDARSDIFSFGVLLYELLTARRPFAGDTASEIIDNIVHRAPDAIARFNYDAPPELERIARKCLEKDRERRYQTARELFIDLQNLQRDHVAKAAAPRDIEAHATSPHLSDAEDTSGDTKTARVASSATTNGIKSRRLVIAAGVGAALIAVALGYVWQASRAVPVPVSNEIKSLAVLPLVNSGGAAEQEYLADGITESLINRLSQLPNLKVMARNTVFRFKGKDADAQSIARTLGVRAVMTGNVQQIDDQLVINVELIDAHDGSVIASQQYIRKAADVIVMQANIAQDVVSNLRVKLSGADEQKLAKNYTENAEAYRLYLKGRYYWEKYPAPGFEKSRDYFQQAIALDPNYALAYAGLADYYSFASTLGILPPDENNWLKAEAAAKKAQALEESRGEAYNSLAAVRLYYYRDWAGAEQYFKRGIELSSNFAEIRHHYALNLIYFGSPEAALAQMKKVLELEPLSARSNRSLAWTFYHMREYDRAIEQYRKTLELEPNDAFTHELLGDTYEQKGMPREAVAEWSKALRLIEDNEAAMTLERTFAASGFNAAVRALWQKKLERLNEKVKRGEYVPAMNYVLAYTRLADKEQAFAWLAKAEQERNGLLYAVKLDPIYDSLRDDSRFQDLLRRVGLPQ